MNLELELGRALAVIGAILAGWHWIRRQGMLRAKGSVVRVEALDSAPASKSQVRPVKLTVRFTDGQGLVRFFTGSARGDDRKPGDAIGVLYRSNDPAHAMLDDMSIWVAPIVVAAIGLGLAIMGLVKL